MDILSAYSWDTGNIFIDEANDIELGLYLPLFGYEGQVGAIGASVAANNGIVVVDAQGDILVNSVVAPRGGVLLWSQEGSIYAGQGWCPRGRTNP